jgi:hypothetical protein
VRGRSASECAIAVLDPLRDAKAGPVHERRHGAGAPVHLAQHGVHLLAGQDNREPLRAAGADDSFQLASIALDHASVQIEKRGKRLVLRGRAHLLVDRQVCQERVDLLAAECFRMAPAVESDVPFHPARIGPRGVRALVLGPHPVPVSIEEPTVFAAYD